MLKIYNPVPHKNVQRFGENLPCCKVDSNGKAIRPFIMGVATSGLCPSGYIKYYQAIGQKGHNGDDFSCPIGTTVYHNVETEYPDMDWLVLHGSNFELSGNVAIVVSTKPIAIPVPKEQGQFNMATSEYIKLGGKLHVGFRYAHLNSIAIPHGSFIKQGEIVGVSGNTGKTTGAHLHRGMAIHQSSGLGFSVDDDNGFNGCVDTTPFIVDTYKITSVSKKFLLSRLLELLKIKLYG